MSGDGGRWSAKDLALLRTLGARLSQLIHGEDVEFPDQKRRDELGILANMVSRLARELHAARQKDREHRAELEARVAQLQAAYDTQETLLATIREISSPLLDLHEDILLLPLIGALDGVRVAHVSAAVLPSIAQRRPEILVIHLMGGDAMTPDVAALLLRLDQAARRHGARAVLLSGAPQGSPGAVDLSSMTRCATLPEALAAALDLLGLPLGA
jgi:rsbT co-antagonist protein RsbR